MNELSDKDRPRKLEDIFREGMGEAEIAPSDRLWSRIEQNLDQKETDYYKKRLGWYQSVAAACIALLVCAGAYLFYDFKTTHNSAIAVTQPTPQNNAPASATAPVTEKQALSGQTQVATTKAAITTPNTQTVTAQNNVQNKTNTLITSLPTVAESQNRLAATNFRTRRSDTGRGSQAKQNINPSAGNNFNQEGALAANAGSTATTANSSIIGAAENTGFAPTTAEVEPNNLLEPLPAVRITALAFSSKLALPDSLKSLTAPGINNNTYLASSEETKKKKSARWSIGGKYSSQYFNQNIALAQAQITQPNSFMGNSLTANSGAPYANTAAPSTYSEAMSEFDKNTASQYSYNTAVSAAYQFNKHWSVETGVDYTQNVASTTSSYVFRNQLNSAARMGNGFMDKSIVAAPEAILVPTNALVAAMAAPADVSNNAQVVRTPQYNAEYRYRMVGLPIKMSYRTGGQKSFYYASVGFLTNLLVQAHILSDSPKVPDIKYGRDSESPFRNLQMAALASVGKGFRLGKGFNIQAGLEGAQYLNTLAANPEALQGKHRKPYTVGLALSSSYTLSR